MNCRWSSSPSGREGLGARGQGWWLLLLLLVHLLKVLLPGPHLGILQLLHVEGLSVGQELLPLILQLRHQGRLLPGAGEPVATASLPTSSCERPQDPTTCLLCPYRSETTRSAPHRTE